jgi:hypothetical protein
VSGGPNTSVSSRSCVKAGVRCSAWSSEDEKLDKNYEVVLLRRFGSEAVSRPFVLNAQ